MTPELKFVEALKRLPKQDVLATRNAVSALIKTCLAESRQLAEQQLVADGQGTLCAEHLSSTEDAIIRKVIAYASSSVFPGEGDIGLSAIAVGGYGRGTLAPGSDIDLLFLLYGNNRESASRVVEFLLYALWDARQKVGHATRSIDECI